MIIILEDSIKKLDLAGLARVLPDSLKINPSSLTNRIDNFFRLSKDERLGLKDLAYATKDMIKRWERYSGQTRNKSPINFVEFIRKTYGNKAELIAKEAMHKLNVAIEPSQDKSVEMPENFNPDIVEKYGVFSKYFFIISEVLKGTMVIDKKVINPSELKKVIISDLKTNTLATNKQKQNFENYFRSSLEKINQLIKEPKTYDKETGQRTLETQEIRVLCYTLTQILISAGIIVFDEEKAEETRFRNPEPSRNNRLSTINKNNDFEKEDTHEKILKGLRNLSVEDRQLFPELETFTRAPWFADAIFRLGIVRGPDEVQSVIKELNDNSGNYFTKNPAALLVIGRFIKKIGLR